MQQTDKLNTYYNKRSVGLDEGERLIREIQEMREQVNEHQNIIESMVEQSQQVVPLKLRSQRQTKAKKVTTICAYKQLSVSTHSRNSGMSQ